VADEDEGGVIESTGESCPQCEGLDGRYFSVDPTPFHERCDCEVRQTWNFPRAVNPKPCGENDWTIEWIGNTRYGPGARGLVTHWQITVLCWNGQQLDKVADIDHGENDVDVDTLMDEAWIELYDEAEEMAAQGCRGCPEDELVG
jgi:hypothetical protein